MSRKFLTQFDERRKAAGWSQAAVAAACGMTQGHYSKIIAGHVPLSPKAKAALEGWSPSAPRTPRPPQIETAELRAIAANLRRQVERIEAVLMATKA